MQEELLKEYNRLIEIVIKYGKSKGEEIDEEIIAKRLERSKKYINNLKNGHAALNDDHIKLFKIEFREELNLSDDLTEIIDPDKETYISVKRTETRLENVETEVKDIKSLIKIIGPLVAIIAKEKITPDLNITIQRAFNGDLSENEFLDLIKDLTNNIPSSQP